MAEVWVGTSWKMTKTIEQARDYARELREVDWGRGVHPFVVPPATALNAVAEVLAGSPVLVGAQDAHWEDEGAWTGEVSVPQVADAGARILEIGHSERRQHFGETDERVNLKVRAALRHGLLPLVCVGEREDQRPAAADVVAAQVRAAFAGVDSAVALVAYEPVWAIGSGGRAATPAEITEPMAAVVAAAGPRRTVLYGGSVQAGNAAGLMAVPGVGGLFVGRAAWSVQGLVDIARVVARYGGSV